jgi:hypothetical protein
MTATATTRTRFTFLGCHSGDCHCYCVLERNAVSWEGSRFPETSVLHGAASQEDSNLMKYTNIFCRRHSAYHSTHKSDNSGRGNGALYVCLQR